MAIAENIEYVPHGAEFASFFENDYANWEYSNSVKSAGITYAGVAMHRGIKIAVARPKMTAPLCYTKRSGVFERSFERPEEIHFLGSPGFSADDLSVATVRGLGEILFAVNELAFQADEDEYGLMRPSYHAHRQCMRILLGLAQKGEFVKPSEIGTDRNGAIRIAWVGDIREAELVCPSDETEPPYIYVSSDDSYATDTNVTPEGLLSKIRWAKGGE